MTKTELPKRALCLVTDIERAGGEEPMLRTVDAAVRGGVNMVQVRAHHLDSRMLIRFARSVTEKVAGRALVIVNGSVPTALEIGADGLHLPEKGDIDSGQGNQSLLVGQSAHSVAAAERAVSRDVDYLILGTLFPSKSHPQGKTGGTKLVEDICAVTDPPVIGIGGITEHNAPSVIEAGACGVAVIGAIIEASDTVSATKRMADAIGLQVRQ